MKCKAEIESILAGKRKEFERDLELKLYISAALSKQSIETLQWVLEE